MMKCKYCNNEAVPGYMICKVCLHSRTRINRFKKKKKRIKRVGYIYLIKDPSHKLYKIGRCDTKWPARIDQIRVFLPVDPEIIFEMQVYDYVLAESLIHQHFKHYNFNRGWFKFPFYRSERWIIKEIQNVLEHLKHD